MLLSKAVAMLGVGFLMGPGIIAFGLAFLVSTILGCLMSHGNKSGFYFWCTGLALNVPTLVLLASFTAGVEPASVDPNIVFLIAFVLSPFGIGWLIGSTFGLLIRVAAANTRGYQA